MRGSEQKRPEVHSVSKKPYRLAQQEVAQLEEKIQSHRKRILKLALLLTILGLIVAGSLYYVYQTRTYNNYQVVESIKRQDSAGTQFVEFNGNILKYSNDGAFYIDAKNQLIWNQTYEMQSPILDICEGYVTIADRKGKKIYIMDKSGPCGEVDTNRPIRQVHVANQGMVAVLMEENGTGYIQLYDKDGSFLAEGELHTKNSGYPIDISISNDGKKMAVSMWDVNEGNVKTTVAFYNFGSVGQNEIDNIVSSYSYSDTVIPKVEFLTNDVAVAFGDTQAILYEGSQKPVEKTKLSLKREIRSLFFNDHYFGFVYENENSQQAFSAEIYDTHGKMTRSFDFSMDYEEIGFLQNDEICIRNSLECSIYTLRGIQRFHYNFEKDIYKILHAGGHQYIFLMAGTTEKVKLK